MMFSDLEKSLKIFRPVGPALDCQKIDNLNEEFGLAVARGADCINQLPESGQKSIVTDSQERAAGNIANAGSFDDQGSRLTLGEASVPIQVLPGDKAIFSGTPGHHRRDPGARSQLERTNSNRLKQ